MCNCFSTRLPSSWTTISTVMSSPYWICSIFTRDSIRQVVSPIHIYPNLTLNDHQYRKYRPNAEELGGNRGRALLTFAGRAILADIHERNRRWTWAYFAERRDDRTAYVELFKKQMLNQLVGNVSPATFITAIVAFVELRADCTIAGPQELRSTRAQADL